ncbi:MAG TPA: DUF5916 domain-containing protein [Candidatus Acidoferrum sp.]|nr:DUF5916 domain-containing protein [Candidatus Acidoferrum sp.]
MSVLCSVRTVARRLLLSLSVASCCWSLAAHGQSQRHVIDYQIPHTSQRPVIDGVFDADEWRDALRVELVNETFPGQNVTPPVATEVYLMEDGENFYAVFVAQDPDPSQIRAYYRDRDRAYQDDFVGLVIDTFNDERRAFEFFANPFGAQMDLIQDDVSKREDDSWNALWDSYGKINDKGFVVEMKIPLKQLRLPSGLDHQTWGLDILRFYPRDARHRISNNLMDYAVSCYLCQFKKAEGFGAINQSTNLQLIPTLTTSWAETRPAPATDPWQRGNPDVEPSLDVRWGINKDMILNATINPDFSQVEADQAQLDVNNTFSLYFPERREFFLDGAEYFNTLSSGNNNLTSTSGNTLVYTRNISSPGMGVKLTGKSDNQTYAVMAADDDRTGFIIPGNQGSSVATLDGERSRDLAMRYRYDFGRELTVGTLVTDREATGYSNSVVSTDFNWQAGPSDRVLGQFMHSNSEYPLAIQTGFNQKPEMSDNAWSLEYNHQGRNWNWVVSNTDFGRDFRADLGFIGKVDYREQVFKPGYTWIMEPGGLLNRVGVWGMYSHTDDQTGMKLQENRWLGVWANGKYQSYAELDLNRQQTYYNGRYFDLTSAMIFSNIQPMAGVQLGLNVTQGDAIDYANTQLADNMVLSPWATLQLGRHMQVAWNYSHQTLDVSSGRLFTTDLHDLRLTWQFDNRSFVRAVLIYSDTVRNPSLYTSKVDPESKSLATQLLYSYRVNAQTRFYVGYSDNAMQDATVQGLEATYRTVFAKFSYAWQY